MEVGSVIRKKITLAIRIFDDYTLKSIENGLNIYIDGTIANYIKKSGGYYIFTNMKLTKCKIDIQSDMYFTESFEIDIQQLNKLDPIFNVRLKLKPSYFLRNDSTIIKLNIVDSNKSPIKNGEIKAFINTKNYYEGIFLDDAKKNHVNVNLKGFFNEFLPGDVLYIKEDSHDKSEFIKISKVSKEHCILASPLICHHDKEMKLLSAFTTQSDEHGNVLIYFKNLIKKEVHIRIHIYYKEHFKELNAKVVEGDLLNLGTITI